MVTVPYEGQLISMSGEPGLVLWVPPEMRVSQVAELAAEHLRYRTVQLLQNSDGEPSLIDIAIVNGQGMNVCVDRIFHAWPIGSIHPGSVIPRWMLEVEMSKRQAYFAQARLEAQNQEGWGQMDELQAAISDSDLQWEEYRSQIASSAASAP